MGVQIHLEGDARVRAMLAQYSDREMTNKLRRAARAGIGGFRPALVSEAQSRAHHGVPGSFSKMKTRSSTRGGGSGSEIESSIRPASPLFNILQVGAGRHTIAPHHGRLEGPAGLGFWTRGGRKRGRAFFSRRPVSHPGLKARDLLGPAFALGLPAAEAAVEDVIFGVVR